MGMKFWDYIENLTCSGWCNTVIAGLIDQKSSISENINFQQLLFGNNYFPNSCTVLYCNNESVPNFGNIIKFICYRDIGKITLKANLDSFALKKTKNDNFFFIFEPSQSLINKGDTDVLVYSINVTGQVNKL